MYSHFNNILSILTSVCFKYMYLAP